MSWLAEHAARAALLLPLLLGACASGPQPTAAGAPAAEADAAAMSQHPERMIVLAVANPQEAIPLRAGSTPVYGLTPRYTAGGNARATLAAIEHDHGLRELAAWPISALRLHCVVVEIASTASRDAVLATLAKDPRVQLAQPLQNFVSLGGNYNDPYTDLQRGFVEINAEAAHHISRGKGVRVAVIDTGLDTRHPDLRPNVALARNFVDGDTAEFDRGRHGTEVAGIIAAVANNGEGMVGAAPEARLMALKACWETSRSEAGAHCNSFTLAQALSAAIDGDAQVVNLSLGGPADELLTRLVLHLVRRGSVVVGAVPPNGNLSGFPIGIPGVIAVDTLGRGLPQPHVLYAPGRDILTLMPGGRYDFDSGSSLAAAHVSGAVALLLAAEPGLDGHRISALLERSGSDSGAVADIARSIDACAALAALRNAPSCLSGAPLQAAVQPAAVH